MMYMMFNCFCVLNLTSLRILDLSILILQFNDLIVLLALFVVSDILHIFSYLPRYLNFIEHTSNIGWKE